MYYSLRKYKNDGTYNILTDISEHITLVEVINYLGNVNHAIIVVEYRIFDSKYKRALVLNRKLLDMICAPSVGKKEVARFKRVIYAVR